MKSEFYSKYYDGRPDNLPFAVRSLGYNHCASGFRFAEMLKKHPEDHRFVGKSGRVLETVSIGHITRGRGYFRSNASGALTVKANSILVVFPGVRHSLRYEQKIGWDGEWVEMEPDAALPILYNAGITPNAPLRQFKALSTLSNRYHELMAASMKNENQGQDIRLAAAAYRVLAEVVSVWGAGVEGFREAGREELLEVAKRQLAGEGGKVVGIEQVARMTGYSASQFRVVFKKKEGVTPKSYQLQKRIERCCQMLQTTRMSVTAIAEANGFESIFAFSRQFHRTMGCSPQSYRAGSKRK